MIRSLNPIVLLVLADLDRREDSGCIVIESGKLRRAIHVSAGRLQAVESNLKAERLGDMLAAEGVLSLDAMEVVAEAAAKKKALLGDQLVADGHLSQSEMAAALDRQVYLRFGAALAMRGTATIEPMGRVKAILDVPLAPVLVTTFREWVPLPAIEGHLADPSREPRRLDLGSPAIARLELGPAELRLCKKLAAGATPEAIIAEGAPREPVLRLAGALSALQLWG